MPLAFKTGNDTQAYEELRDGSINFVIYEVFQIICLRSLLSLSLSLSLSLELPGPLLSQMHMYPLFSF